MLLTITTTHQPATDLGFLLAKNPGKVQSFLLSFGKAHVFYTEATETRCTAALLLDVDPVGLVRKSGGPAGESFALQQYVNDRPYVASSFMSVAISQVFGSALAGRSKDRQSLAETPIPLEAALSVLPCRSGEILLRKLFEPLGYTVTATRHSLDEKFPEWGESAYFSVTLAATCKLKDLLTHLYVLIPVLDNDKHYWVSDDEVKKLLRHGEGWLAEHPEREQIVKRYLKHQKSLTREALERLVAEEEPDMETVNETRAGDEAVIEEKIRLNEQRIEDVINVLKECGAKRVLDLGCGEGKILRALLKEKEFAEIAGMDVSHRALEIAQEKLRLERLPDKQKARIKLLHGSLMYRDKRLSGYDAALVIEVVEHLDAPRLAAFERVLFEFAKPENVVLTTPNAEYNVKFENLPAGKLRHKDHRFEWTRAEFQAWAQSIAQKFGYTVEFRSVGNEDPATGAPTQMGMFTHE